MHLARHALVLAPLLFAGCAAPAPPVAEGARAAGEPAAAERDGPPDRRFHVRYTARLDDLPPGAPVRLWIPLPRDDPHQRVAGLAVSGPWEAEVTEEPRWGNRMAYLEGRATEASAEVVVTYDVARWEDGTDRAAWATDGEEAEPLARYLEPSTLVAPDATIEATARELTAGRGGTLARGRAFYDHVLETMSYDKSGVGWGRGDARYACQVGRGNCTDFHAYFMALCLAERIPVRFQIGLFGSYEPLPGQATEVGGYHCWALFRVPGRGWVPVDISEADKHPARAEEFFGLHTANRVTLSEGRDLTLAPPQAGPPLNFFVDPYAEVDGVPHAGVAKAVRWTDLGG